ncbi:MAG TPA: dockerin type I domain-containing protein [Bacteroidales bacterium]|nr:dockerin type I domain-containing protein [Bacteroidales bacterium]
MKTLAFQTPKIYRGSALLTGLILLWLCGPGIRAQNIVQVEYFFNTDPGFGAGIQVPVSNPAPLLDNFNFGISTTGLTEGFYRLFIRARDDSGSWSRTYDRAFLINSLPFPSADVTEAEYFLDQDPGPGQGQPIPFTPGQNIQNLTYNIDITSLEDGIHRIFVRVKDAAGSWSLTHHRTFLKQIVVLNNPEVVAAEYFFDQDPGFGQGNAIPLTPGQNLQNLLFTADITGLEQGIHRIFVRVKDTCGNWSLTHHQSFLRQLVVPGNPEVAAAEYFFDQDPGFGNGTAIPVAVSGNVTLDFTVDISTLAAGFHQLFVRVKDNLGCWSITHFKSFLKEVIVLDNPLITNLEYFIDTDPGFGNGQPIPFTPSVNLTSVGHIINIAALNNGFHTLSVRAMDENGRWSITQFKNFLKQVVVLTEKKINRAEYFINNDPGFGQGIAIPVETDSTEVDLSFTADLTSLNPGFHRLFVRTQNEAGRWSHSKIRAFYKKEIQPDTLPLIVAVEYFIDTDPGAGNGHAVNVNPSTNTGFLAFQLDLDNVAFGQHFLFVRAKDENGRWSLITRDTIFYYLDSLPTAMLTGPEGFCINSSGEFEVTLTGTPPWTITWFNGEDTLTQGGIMNSPFVYQVSPSWSGTHTAKVLQVQDVYYTGLYTGIPIEYQVYPLPAAAGPVNGPEHLCQGAGHQWYWINPVQHATAYQWTYPAGAVAVSGQNNSSILLDFTNVTGPGLVSVTPVNACGPGQSSQLTVTVHELPVVDAGPDQNIPFEDSALMAPVVTGGSEPYSWYWYPYWLVNNPYIPAATAYPQGNTTFTLYVTDANGCQASDQVTIYVGLPPGTQVNGVLTYDNSLSTPLNEATVFVRQGTELIATGTTGSAGDFSIPGLPAGFYTLSASSAKPWGGVNATDALLVLQHFTVNIELSGLRLQAADVNQTGSVNAIDALLIARRYTELITSFPSGDWLSDIRNVYVPGTGMQTENLEALAYGDVNGSYVPAAKFGREVEIRQRGMLHLTAGQAAGIPLCATGELQAGAVSLSLRIPQGIRVLDVSLSPAYQKHGEVGPVLYNIVEGDLLKIAWYSLNPLELQEGDPLLWIKIEAADGAINGWEALEGSSIANGMGQTIAPLLLEMPLITINQEQFTLAENYPNPFAGETMVSFSIPEAGMVHLSLVNALGQTVKQLVNEQLQAGSHQIVLDGSDLGAGSYYCRLLLESKAGPHLLTRKMIIQR